MAFLVTVHTMLFFAGASGLLEAEQSNNPHKKVIDNFNQENSTETGRQAQVNAGSGIIEQTFSPITAISGLINDLQSFLFSPYSALEATQLPALLQTLIGSLMGLTELYVAYLAVRGGL
jgi:hypothetical protein